MNYKGCPVYLRDLSDEAKRDLRSSLTRFLFISEDRGDDVVVGYYLPLDKCYLAGDKSAE